MSTNENPVDEQNTAPTPGEMLRDAREKAGLSQQQMADKLFLKLKNVVDIENDHLDEAMSATFQKGYVRMYARQLGIQEAPVIDSFNRLHTVTRPPARLQSFSKRVAKQAHDDRWMMVTWIMLLLLVVALVAWWYQQSDGLTFSEPSAEKEAATTRSESPQAADPAVSESAQPSLSAAEEASDTAIETAAAETNPEDTAPLHADIQPEGDQPEADVSDVAESAPEQSSGDMTGVDDASAAGDNAETTDITGAATVELVFTFAEDCWINIEDATGEAIAYGVKASGRVMPVSGQPPFKVTLGAPDGVSITYDDEAVDISAFQVGRIARFTLPMQD